MISCDTNVLFAAVDADNAHHARSRAFLGEHAGNPSFVLAEQVLMELYSLVRNPVISRPSLDPAEATALIQQFRRNPHWRIVDVTGEHRIMDEAWRMTARKDFAYRRIFDVRLGLTLRHHGVTDFATSNTHDFDGLDFKRIWNPLA